MPYIETPEKTVLRFIQSSSWQTDISPRSLTPQLISVSKETKREPDLCYFEIENGILLDSDTGQPILSSIERETPLQETEYQVAVQLQDWAAKNDQGVALWISPRFPGEYPCEKISIHTIAYKSDGKKIVLNSYILFDAILKNPEDLRKFIFTEKDSEETFIGILDWIKRVSEKPVNINTLNHEGTTQQASYFATRIRSGIAPETIVEEMVQTGFLGQNPISCPGGGQSFSRILAGRSNIFIFPGLEDQYGSLEFPCPACGEVNTRPFGQLISNCQRCGADVRC